MTAMSWQRLLSRRRLGTAFADDAAGPRTDFQRDFDRIVFSSAFRRLQDKTQVFPLAKSDYVRTRLTHSMEVASVGRSLGALAGKAVLKKDPALSEDVTEADFGSIVAAACLAHDIGNPPFGHAGESAIQEWFTQSTLGRSILDKLAPSQRQDFERFEGNAQGFRTICRLQNLENPGGMQLTCATLGAFTKYPRASHVSGAPLAGVSGKKHGFVNDDRELFETVAHEVGLLTRPGCTHAWFRHPLAFLVEAADDICYRIIDVEDGFRTGHLDYSEVEHLFFAIVTDSDARKRAGEIGTQEKRVEYLRAKAINAFVMEAQAVFCALEEDILRGAFDAELIGEIPHAGALKAFSELGKRKVYQSRPVLEIEAPGFSVLGSLMEAFVGAANEMADKKAGAEGHSRSLFGLIPSQFLGPDRTPDADLYRRVLQVTDYVAGVTDSYAVDLFRKVRGMALASR